VERFWRLQEVCEERHRAWWSLAHDKQRSRTVLKSIEKGKQQWTKKLIRGRKVRRLLQSEW
jgi:hypothetical protein